MTKNNFLQGLLWRITGFSGLGKNAAMDEEGKIPEVGLLDYLAHESEKAAGKYYGERFKDIDVALYNTIDELFAEVEAGNLDAGVIPEQNSISGVEEETLDGYWNRDVYVARKEVLPRTYSISAAADATIDGIKEVMARKEDLEQCLQWLGEKLPDAKFTPVYVAYKAADLIHESGNSYLAVIGTEPGFPEIKLKTLASDIGNSAYNKTEFGIIKPGFSTPRNRPEPTGDDESNLIIMLRGDYSGQLGKCMGAFRKKGVETLRIISRPANGTEVPDGRVVHLNLTGHLNDDNFKSALMDVVKEGAKVKPVGSYARTEFYKEGR